MEINYKTVKICLRSKFNLTYNTVEYACIREKVTC